MGNTSLREVKAQDKIGVCFNDLFEQVAGILAVWSLNAVYVPLDPQLPRQRLSYIIEDSAIHTVITGSNEKLAWDAKHALVVPRTHCLTAPQELIAKLAHVDIVNTHVAYVIYTSGSTGKPKGVAVTHANLSNVLFGVKELFSIDADDLMPVLASFGFDISLFEIFLPLIAGGGVIAVDKSKILDLEYLLRRIASASLLHAVPSLMQEIIHLKNHIGNEGSSNSVVLGRLRQAFVGGDRVSPTLLEQMDNAFCDAQIIELYGPTEATIISTAYFYRKGDDSARYLLGEALPHCNIEIIDDNGQPLPFGVPGEIFISGEGISQGYIGREDITEKQFVTYSTGVGRGYKTGDLGRYLNSGEIEYLGRRDNQIKIRGFRVELGEIEAVLEQHATIEKAVVSLVSRNQAKQLVAHVLMNSALDHDVRDFVHEKLPDYMQPSTIARIDEIPLTSNGKYDRRRIQSLAEAEISKASVNDDEEKLSRQLHTDLEKELSQLACDILGIDNRNVDFGFFDVGGDSIQAIRFMTSLRQNGYAVTPQLLFQNNTLLSLAQAIEHGESTCEEKVAVCYKSEVMPLQNWFLRSDRVNRNIFTQSVLISVEEGFSVDAFEASLRALIEQHPVLASRFELEEGTWHQTIDPISNTKLQSLFDQHECCDEDDVINIYSKAQSQLDIQAGIVFKTLLLRTPEGDVKNILMLAHHLVVDTVSWQILLQQLLHNYQLALNDLPLQRSNGGQSYLQWSNWLVQDKLQSVWTESQREQESLHWVQECNAPKLQLPFDGNVECPKVGDEVHVERKLSKVLTEQLLANGQYDLETCLQACLVQQLGEWADQPKVTLLLEAHGRELLTNNLDISQAIGWFTSAYPLSFKVDAKLEKTASYVASKKKCILNSGFGFAFSVNEEQYAEGVTQSVAFNYLGRVQTAQNGLTGFTLEDTKAFDNESGEERSRVPLVFTASIRDHVLHLDIKFNTLQFKLESIEALLDGIDQSLHKLDEVIDSKTDESELCLPLNSVSSDNAPVILFAPVEGNLNDYKHLVTAIGEERSVWGVLSPHAVAAVDDFYSIEEMAAQQIRSVAKKIDPTSTLVLVGWSMGGILATEFARFWTGSVRLVLLDSNPYPPKLENNPYSLDRLMRLCHTMKIDTKALIDARVDYAQGKQSLENIHSVALKLKLIDERIQLEALDGQLQLIHKNFVSASRYSPGLYSEEVLMLRATQTLETSDEGSILHQEGFVSLYPQCNWVEVDSNHFEMVNEKHASKIADQIKQYISNI